MSENCYECGHSVEWGSGRYVNRVPADCPDDMEEYVKDPSGEWICAECLHHEEVYGRDQVIKRNPQKISDQGIVLYALSEARDAVNSIVNAAMNDQAYDSDELARCFGYLSDLCRDAIEHITGGEDD